MAIRDYVFEKITLAGTALDITFNDDNSVLQTLQGYDFIGIEMTFSAAYTGTINSTRVPGSDTANDPSLTETGAALTTATTYKYDDPNIHNCSAGDKIQIVSSAVFTGDIQVRVRINEYPIGAPGRIERSP